MIKKLIWFAIIIGIALYFIPVLLEQFSLYIDGLNTDSDEPTNARVLLLPPDLDPVPSATNSARLKVSGFAEQADRVEIFINDISKKKISVKQSNRSFQTTLDLFQGPNDISLIAIDENGNESDYSDTVTVSYIAEGPELIIDSPQNDVEIRGENPTIDVRGITSADASVTINGRWVRVKSDGTFTHSQRLDEGENILEIVATGPAGNVSRNTLTVRYSK